MSTERLFEPYAFLSGGGEMGQLTREQDWANTPIGAISTWPEYLRAAVSLCLTSRFPIVIFWGSDFRQFYNDAYRSILGPNKHPRALGQRAQECWAEIWDVIGPMLDGVVATSEATWSNDLLLVLERNVSSEEAYFTFSYSPILDEAGSVAGIFCAVTETTGNVLGQRRLNLLQSLATRTAIDLTAEQVCQHAAATIGDYAADLPFALLYLLDADSQQAHLAGNVGLRGGSSAAPHRVTLAGAEDIWSLGQVVQSGQQVLLDNLRERMGALDGYDAGQIPPPERALVLPLSKPAYPRPYGLLIAGLSPRRPFDEAYQSFCALVAGQIGTSLTSALAYLQERQRAEALAELDRAKTAFFNNVSHEFRTPLTLSLGPLEEVLSERAHPLADEQRRQLEMVRRNELRQLKLVNTLLDFSRIEAGRVDAAYAPSDLAQLTRDLASAFRSAIEHAGLKLVVECPPLPEPIYVDHSMWEKIVLNLLSNALKYTFEGEIHVALKLVDASVELIVQDTGVGISAQDLPHLFERFYRARNARARTHEGSGIGLALVQELVRLHGGSIGVKSQEGIGTTFTIRLPRGHAHLPEESLNIPHTLASIALGAEAYVQEVLRWLPDPETASPANNHSIMPGDEQPPFIAHTPATTLSSKGPEQTTHLLVADDNADMREYLKRLLSPSYHVTLVADGSSVLEMTRAVLPDLIISDIMMPGLDGLALLKELRSAPTTANIPVILLSARAGEEATLEGLKAGADDYLIKPFSARELLARVETRLEIASLLEQTQTARAEREAERDRLYNVLAQAPVPLAILRGPEHIYDLVNEAYQKLAGGRARVGQSFQASLPELIGQGPIEAMDQVYQSGEPLFATEYPILAQENGEPREHFFNFTYQPLHDFRGRVEGVMQVGFEVTEQVNTRKKIEEVVAELEAVFETMTDGVLVYDTQGRIVRTNQALRRLLAIDRVDDYERLPLAARQQLFQLRDERGEAITENAWPTARVLRGEVLTGAQTVEIQQNTLDGREIWTSVTGAPIRDQHRQIAGALLVLRDVTRHRTLEQQTHSSLDALLQMAHVLIEATIDPGELLEESAWAEHIRSVMRQLAELACEMLNCRRLSIVAVSEPDDPLIPIATIGMKPEQEAIWWEETARQRLQDTFTPAQIAQLNAGETLFLHARDLRERNQEQIERYHIQRLFCAPMRAGTRLVGLLSADHGGVAHVYTEDEQRQTSAVATLVTLVLERERLLHEQIEAHRHEKELRIRNQQLADLIAQAHDAIIVRSLDDRITFWNQGAERLYGWPASYALGQHIHTLFQTRFPDSQEAVQAELYDQGQWEGELEQVGANGGEICVESRQIRMLDAEGRPRIILEINRDITERKRLMDERADARANERMAVEIARTRDEFIGIASHELRTPITAMKGNVQLARRFLKQLSQDLTPETLELNKRITMVTQLLASIERQVDLQNRLVSDLVDVSRIQAKRLELHQEQINIIAVVGEAIADQRLIAPERTITFETEMQRVMVLADAARIGQVVGNYLSNALKYSPAESPVQVHLEVGGDWVRVAVGDEGPGLTPEELERIWERFYRAKGAEEYTGGADLGLGLHISRSLIEQHGGQVGVTSTVGSGSTFWFTLPIIPGTKAERA